VLYLAVTSPTLPLSTLNEYADTRMSQRISMLSGVAQVQVFGAQKYALRIQLDPRELASRGLGLDEVADAAARLNVNLPTGAMQGPQRILTVQADGQLMDAEEWRPAVVAWRNGSPVRLEQLGHVVDSVENDKAAAWFVDQRGVILAVQRQPGANTVEVVDRILKLLPAFRGELPASVTINILYDRSESIRASIGEVKSTLLLTLALVVLVIFLFLRSPRATLIPSLAMPLSIVGSFAVMHLLGYSLDNLSLLALTLSVGFVVDDAIVVLENIVRHGEQGQTAMEAALAGSREIGFTILSMTASLVAVFIPVLFMGGLVGRLLNEFAVTIAVSILISGFVSLTLTPLMCSRWLRPGQAERHGRLYAASERALEGLRGGYDRSLRVVLRHPRLTLLFSAGVLVATVVMFQAVPKGFLPNEDAGRIFVQTEGGEGVSFPAMVALQQQAAAIVAADPRVESYMSSVGSRGNTSVGSNTGTLFIKLVPRAVRKVSVEAVIQDLRGRLAQVAGLRCYLQNPPPIRIGGQLSKSQYQYTLQAPDTASLYEAAPALAAELAKLPELQDVTTDLQLKNPQALLRIDRDRAASLGVSPERIELALSQSFGSRQISTIYTPTNSYQVIIELASEFQGDLSWLSQLYVRSDGGALVPLTAVTDIGESLGPLTVNHLGQLPAVTVSFNLAPGASLGPAVEAVSRVAQQVLPPHVSTSFQGTAQAFAASLQGLGLLLLFAVLVMYLILGVLYESFIHPLTILSALPFAGFGALATLLLFGSELNLYGFVGVILLIGIVKKNGIMMVDFAIEAERSRELPAAEAIYQACLVRFRPIMMTTMAALMGTLPIALGVGAGAESRRSLGLAVVGGLLFSQLVTLYVTPIFYLGLDRLSRRRPVRVEQPAAVAAT
jgi:HAE1 family hydrophobic/amphiphilic exporter-1